MDVACSGDAYCGIDLQCGSVIAVFPLANTGADDHHYGGDGRGEIFQGLDELVWHKLSC